MVDTVPNDFYPTLDITDPEGLIKEPGGRIVLDGLPNTRDLGGIAANSGKFVKHGRLIRSGALEHASDRDLRVLLDDFKVRTVIDLRTEEERREHPDPVDEMPGVQFFDAPVLSASTFGITRGERGLAKAAQAWRMIRTLRKDPESLMAEAYAHMMTDPNSQRGFAQFFQEVLDTEQGAVLWHCTIGKDRAGLAAALLLWALGASQEAILADYLATNCYVEDHAEDIVDALATYGLAEKLEHSIYVLNSANETFLEAAFDAVKRTHGTVDAYLRDALGVTDAQREALQRRYLTDDPKG